MRCSYVGAGPNSRYGSEQRVAVIELDASDEYWWAVANLVEDELRKCGWEWLVHCGDSIDYAVNDREEYEAFLSDYKKAKKKIVGRTSQGKKRKYYFPNDEYLQTAWCGIAPPCMTKGKATDFYTALKSEYGAATFEDVFHQATYEELGRFGIDDGYGNVSD